MSIMAKTPSGYKKIGSAYLGEQPVDKVFNANGDVVYALQRELTGVPPLLFKGKEQSELLNYRICGNTETKQRDYSGSSPLTVPVHDGELYNYRIYGNTVNGESVGDRTENLFDSATMSVGLTRTYINVDGDELAKSGWRVTDYIPCDGTVFTLDIKPYTGYAPAICLYDGNKQYITGAAYNGRSTITVIANQNAKYIRFSYSNDYDLSVVMLNAGSTPLPYEPYGYKVPITVTNSGTTSNETIYLPEPIKMVGSEAEYVDFYSQKQYFADGTNTAVTIPALPISAGTNTVTVNTTVQPSNVEVSVDENVSVGDLVTSGQHAGEYKVPVTVEGKNLFDENMLISPISDLTWYFDDEHYLLVTDTSHDHRAWGYSNSQLRIALSAGTYTLRLSGVGSIQRYSEIHVFKSNNNVIYAGNITGKTNIVITFTLNTPETIGIEVKLYDGKYRIMLVEGSTALPYEPYHAPVTTPIYLPEQIRKVGEEAEYIDYAEQKLHRVRKNLLLMNNLLNASYGHIDGEPFTKVLHLQLRPNTLYTLSSNGTGSIEGDSNSNRSVYFNGAILANVVFQGHPCTAMTNDTGIISIGFMSSRENAAQYINGDAVLQLELGETATEYEPYIENTEVDVTLPALPIIKGTNVLSMDTEVQPSRIDIKGRIKSLT